MDIITSTAPKRLTSDTTYFIYLLIVNAYSKIPKLYGMEKISTKYDELTLTHNLSGVILPSERYQQIYKKGAYLIPPIIALYDDTIDK